MELHSYAKRKVPKKWSIIQKRKLVETRIANDGFFTNKPAVSVAPWKKILSMAKLDDYNVYFVRKQWSNMINKYRQYKLNRLDSIPNGANDPEEIRKIALEWEFFEPIHYFMLNKTTDLHSYALPIRLPVRPVRDEIQDNRNSSNSSPDVLTVDTSDTNDDSNDENYPIGLETKANTDHDFYTKKNGLPSNYFADVSNDTHESMLIEQPIIGNEVMEGMEQIRLQVAGEQIVEMKMEQQSDTGKTAGEVQNANYADTNTQGPGTSGWGKRNRQKNTTERKISEKDRYYRHKRRFNRRLERRFDAILNVFGQIVKAEYPNINVSPIVGVATQGLSLANQLFKSENEFESTEEEKNDSSTDSEQMQSFAMAEGDVNGEFSNNGQ